MASSWHGALALCLSLFNLVFAQPGTRQPVSPAYRGRDACPERCSISGPDPFDWTVYRNLDQLRSCSETVFYQFSLHDAVDDPQTLHRIYACTSHGPDWTNLPDAPSDAVLPAQTTRDASYQIGWWSEDTSRLADADIRTLLKQMRQYLASGYGPTNRGAFLFAQSGRASVGLYIGKGLQNEGTSSFALNILHDKIRLLNATGGSVAMQLCSPGDDGDHIFGLMATSNARFTPIQDALKSWSNAQCLSFSNDNFQSITGPAFLTTPSLNISALNGTNATTPVTNGTNSATSNSTSNSTSRNLLRRISPSSLPPFRRPAKLSPRTNCRSIQVVAGDGCASLAARCGIAGADITKYNTAANFCSTLQPLQHICCSAGTLPDSTPWASFILDARAGQDPNRNVKDTRTGNWTSLQCTEDAVKDLTIPPNDRWNWMDCPDAWKDLITMWKTVDRQTGMSFTRSISKNIHGDELADCGNLWLNDSRCYEPKQCDCFVGSGSGAGAYMIWNSLVEIHLVYKVYLHNLVVVAAFELEKAFPDFENKFAPVPPPLDCPWLQVLLDLVGLGLALGSGSFITKFVAKLPYFVSRVGSADTLKDTASALTATGVSVAKDLSTQNDTLTWAPEPRPDRFNDAPFSYYMAQALQAWASSIKKACALLFDGSDKSIDLLTSLISDGKWIQGGASADPPLSADKETLDDLTASITKAFFGFVIPVIWGLSGTYPFVLDSGYPCGTIDPMIEHIKPETQHATRGCYQNKLYYLVGAIGSAYDCPDQCSDSTFSAPPGISSLNGTNFGGIRVQDLIQGAVRTYIASGNQNGAPPPDPMASSTFEGLMDQDVTTPGYIRLPVCSADMAWGAWGQQGGPGLSEPNYPCSRPKGNNFCGGSSFIDQTSGASPSVADCLQLAANLHNTPTPGWWIVESIIGTQHELVSQGSCKFGVQGIGKNGNVDFNVGNQDIIDIINDSVKKFGWSGKVGAKGSMSCDGNIKGQDVDWGLY